MFNIRDIALEIQNVLGDNYRVYAINNAGVYTDIKAGTSLDKQIAFQEEKISVIMRTQPGTIAALNNLFSTSFSFSLEFYIEATQNIVEDLKRLTSTFNGVLNDVEDYKFMLVFGTPYPTGPIMLQNGHYKQQIVISGECAISDKSLFGNEIKIFVDDYNLENSIITGSGGLLCNLVPPEATENTLTPILVYNNIQSEFTVTLHARKDDPFFLSLVDCYLDSDLLKNRYFKLKIEIFDKIGIWNTVLTSLSFDYSIGGYVIFTVGFGKTQVI